MSSHDSIDEQNEEQITEISVAPDGRVYVFGASAAVLEALGSMGLGGEALRRRLECLKQAAESTSRLQYQIRKSFPGGRSSP